MSDFRNVPSSGVASSNGYLVVISFGADRYLRIDVNSKIACNAKGGTCSTILKKGDRYSISGDIANSTQILWRDI